MMGKVCPLPEGRGTKGVETMRRFSILIVTGLVLMAGATVAVAQDGSEVAMTVQVIENEHRQIMADNLELTPKEASVFWPIYHEYMAAAGKLQAQYVKLLKRFVAHEAGMSDEEISTVFHESMELKKQWLELRVTYFDRIAKAIGARKSARFAQVENKLDALVEYRLAQAIPMVRNTVKDSK